jgi:hypothetical protein
MHRVCGLLKISLEPSNVSNGQREMQEKPMQQKIALNVSVELNEILEPQTDALKEENKILKEKLLQLNKVCDRLDKRYSTLVMKVGVDHRPLMIPLRARICL